MEKNNTCIVDSNFWIGLYHEDDSLHAQAKKIFQQIEQDEREVLITNFIVQEVFTVISLVQNQQKALEFYYLVTNHKRITQIDIEKIIINKIIHFINNNKLNKPLSLVDYSIVFMAHKFDFEIISFDRELMNVYNRLK